MFNSYIRTFVPNIRFGEGIKLILPDISNVSASTALITDPNQIPAVPFNPAELGQTVGPPPTPAEKLNLTAPTVDLTPQHLFTKVPEGYTPAPVDQFLKQ